MSAVAYRCMLCDAVNRADRQLANKKEQAEDRKTILKYGAIGLAAFILLVVVGNMLTRVL